MIAIATLDELTHECLVIRVARKLKAIDVIDVLSDLFILRGIPAHIRSDNGPEFRRHGRAGMDHGCHERSSPWENGYIESFNARLRDELLNGEIFYTCARPRSSSRAGAIGNSPDRADRLVSGRRPALTETGWKKAGSLVQGWGAVHRLPDSIAAG
jgi:transposase InsO family protein